LARYKILMFEPMHEVGLNHLKAHDAEVVTAPDAEEATILKWVADVDGIIARARGFFNGRVMDAAPRLRVIGRHGAGVDNVDVGAATQRGIWVVNTPHAPSEAVAEYVAMALVALTRRPIDGDRATRACDWAFRNRHVGPEVLGKTLGIVGFGRIGRRIAEICGCGFRMRILYADAVRAPEAEEQRVGATQVSLDRLLAESDFVTLNVPLLPETRHMIGRRELGLMKPTAYLVNAARGPVVDEAALVEALQGRRIAGAAVDVYEEEPVGPDNPLLKLDNVLLSPHNAGHSIEAAQKMAMVSADVIRVLKGETPEYPVNRPERPRK